MWFLGYCYKMTSPFHTITFSLLSTSASSAPETLTWAGQLEQVTYTQDSAEWPTAAFPLKLGQRQKDQTRQDPLMSSSAFDLIWFDLIWFDLKKFVMLFIFWQREKDRAWAAVGQRARETQNWKQAPGSELSAQSPMRVSNSQTSR